MKTMEVPSKVYARVVVPMMAPEHSPDRNVQRPGRGTSPRGPGQRLRLASCYGVMRPEKNSFA